MLEKMHLKRKRMKVMSKYFEDQECYKWERANHSMIDEFDKDKIKYMVTPVNQTRMLFMSFSDVYKGKHLTGTLGITKEQALSPNIDEIIKERVDRLKINIEEYKINLEESHE